MQTEITQTIIQKIPMLSEDEQKHLLEEIENFLINKNGDSGETDETRIYSLTFIKSLAIDMGVNDLAENHDKYAHNCN